MNKFIIEQLKKVTVKMPDWDESSTHLVIQKQGAPVKPTNFIEGKTYNISIADYVINPPPGFTLASNWNYGTIPPEKNLEAKVLQIMGNMLKFKCKGVTTGVEWEGWLPKKSITMR